MAGIQDLINKYTRILAELPIEREKIALTIANEAKALAASRVQNEGKNSKGGKMPLYSDKPLPLYYFGNSNNQGAVAKFKKDVTDGKAVSSYETFRRYHGMPTDKRTTTFTGDMWKDVHVEITEKTATKTEVTIKARSQRNQNKLNWNSKTANTNILSLSDEERKLINEAHQEMINEYLKKFE
jgi:hypothetical protein